MSLHASSENTSITGRRFMVSAFAGVLTLVAAGAMFIAPQSLAQTATPAGAASVPALGKIDLDKDPVVADLNGVKVMRSEVFNYIGSLPEQVRQMPLQTLFPLALDQVLNNRIIGIKADTAKLESDPEVTQLMQTAKEQIVRNVYVERELKNNVSEKDLKKAYDKMLTGFEKVEEVRARHILVADEAKARDIIKKINEGAKFEDLAKESSDTPTSQNGGDLGYFAKSEMVPEFAEAAFKLAPGSVSKDPVKTQFGWHVIKVEDKRQRPEPTFESVKPQIEAQVRRGQLNTMLAKWQKEAKITKFDINGEPVKDAPKAAEPAKTEAPAEKKK